MYAYTSRILWLCRFFVRDAMFARKFNLCSISVSHNVCYNRPPTRRFDSGAFSARLPEARQNSKWSTLRADCSAPTAFDRDANIVNGHGHRKSNLCSGTERVPALLAAFRWLFFLIHEPDSCRQNIFVCGLWDDSARMADFGLVDMLPNRHANCNVSCLVLSRVTSINVN
jgi:hypothetical protein